MLAQNQKSDSKMSTSIFAKALEGGYGNLPILPLRPRSKVPCIPEWSKYCRVMPTQAELDSWKNITDAGVTLALGEASGVIVLDFDYDANGIHAEILKLLSPSPVRKVGAKGFSMFYKYNGETPLKRSIDGDMVFEILSNGNHSVLPPSIHPDTLAPYRWSSQFELVGNTDRLPSLPKDFIENINKIFGRVVPSSTKKAGNVSLSELKAALEYVSADDYEQWVHVGMAIKEELGLDGFTLWSEWSKTSLKCKSEELLAKWESFTKDGVGIGTVFYYAKTNGYTKSVDVENIVVDFTEVRATINKWRTEGKPVGESYGWAAMDRLLHIRKKEFTIVTGYTNQGKSEFMDSVAVNLIKNNNWKIGFMSMEKSKENHVAQLIHKLTGKRLESLSELEIDKAYAELSEKALIVDHLNLDKDLDKMTAVIKYLCEDRGANAIIIDPFNYINSTDDALYTHVMDVCKRCTNMAKEFDVHIFLVAHAKDAAYDKNGQLYKPRMYSVFGGSQFSNLVDNLVSVTRFNETAKVETLKVRDQDFDTYGTATLTFNKDTRSFYEDTNPY
jgi:hypothetical protein